MKKTAFGIIIFLLSYGMTNCTVYGITLGYVDFPPYEFVNQGKPSGVLVEIVESIFRRNHIQLELEFFPFKRAYTSTKNGKIDGLFNFYKTEHRLQFFDYTVPIIKNPLVIFVRKDSPLTFHQLDDLSGLTVGVMNGYTYGSDFDDSPLFIKDTANSHRANFKKLMVRRIDAYPCDKLVGIHVATQNNLMSELKILPTPLKVMDGHIGFTKNKHRDVIQKINIVIMMMHETGEINQMINNYIKKNL